MLRNFIPRQYKTRTEYALTYDDDHGNGFEFPCDANGNVRLDMTEAALENLAYCRVHPEKFSRAGKVIRYDIPYIEPATGICICGHTVELYDQYQGACQCENCGRWYNLFGQELLPPEYWEEEQY